MCHIRQEAGLRRQERQTGRTLTFTPLRPVASADDGKRSFIYEAKLYVYLFN